MTGINNSVTVVIPSYGRPERLNETLTSLLRTAPDVEVIAVIPADDIASRAVADKFVVVNIVTQQDSDGAVGSWNRGAAAATGDYLVLAADDLIFHEGWMEEALIAMGTIRNYGMVGFNDLSPNSENFSPHYMVSRAYAVNEWGGVICCPHYGHGCVDFEAIMRSKRDSCFAYAEKSIVEHLHYQWEKSEYDSVYERGAELSTDGEEIFLDRKERGFPNDYPPSFDMVEDRGGWGTVAIGVRTYSGPEPNFFASWNKLITQGLRAGDNLLDPAVGKPSHIAANHLVHSFLATKCNSLLFVDDDGVIPADALQLLRSNTESMNHDVVSAFVTHRTMPPHAVVMEAMDPQPGPPLSHLGIHYGTLERVEDNAVIDVDAVGLAFTMIKRHVIEAMLSEYGALYTSWFNWGAASEGEDIIFSQRCIQHGFRLAVDTNVKIGHIGRYTYTWDDHKSWLKQREKQTNV